MARLALALVASLPLLLVALLASGCGGGASAEPCPIAQPLTTAEWQAGLQGIDETRRLAEAGQGAAAFELLYSKTHDLVHRAIATACPKDRAAAKSLSGAVEALHVYLPEEAAKIARDLVVLRAHYIHAASVAGVPLH